MPFAMKSKVPMCHRHSVPILVEELRHLVGDCHRPMVTSCAAERYIEMILSLVDISRNQVLEQSVVLIYELICKV